MKKFWKIVAISLITLLSFVSCEKEPKKVLEKLEIVEPTVKTYKVNDPFDSTGFKATAVYSDLSEKDVTSIVEFSFFDNTKAGKKEITVSYTEDEITVSAKFEITYEEIPVYLKDILIDYVNVKRTYTVGEEFDKTGLKVTAFYTNGEAKDVTDKATITGFDNSKRNINLEITVSYKEDDKEFSDSFTVDVLDKYKVTFHANGGEGTMEPQFFVEKESKLLTDCVFTNDGFYFYDWVTKDNESYSPSSKHTFTKDIDLYARWTLFKRLPAGTDGTAGKDEVYIEYGRWPQSKKADDVTVKDGTYHNIFNETANGSDSTMYFSLDFGGEKGKVWYKNEPIKWRVIGTHYDSKDKSKQYIEIIPENILYILQNRVNSSNHNELSAFISGNKEEWDEWSKDYTNRGFIQGAFLAASEERSLIVGIVDYTESYYKYYVMGDKNLKPLSVSDYAAGLSEIKGVADADKGSSWLFPKWASPIKYVDNKGQIKEMENDTENYEKYFGVVPCLKVELDFPEL